MHSEKRGDRAAQRKRIYIKFGICVIWVIIMLAILYADHPLKAATVHRRVRREQQEPPEECENDGKWDEKLKRCTCTLGWVGNRCEVWHHHYCYFDNGVNYRGKLSVTSSGSTCLSWTTEENSRFKLGKHGIGVHNYCRNPDNDEKGIWCYVGGEDFIGYCNATRCPDALKDLLLRNTTEIETEDDTSAAVQFLFGPLISGVCVGVVFLLGFIAVAEYLRRRRYFARRKKAQEKKENKMEKGEKPSKNDKEKHEKSSSNKNEKEADEWTEIRPLGGIITVDVDTGKEKWQTFPEKGMSKASLAAFGGNDFGYDNIGYVLQESKEDRNTSAESTEIGPPPPYNQERTPPVLRVSDDVITDVISNVSETIERRKGTRTKRKNKRRNRQRSESSRASMDSNKDVVEESPRVEEYPTVTEAPEVERPVPKPRTSVKKRQSSKERTDKTSEQEERHHSGTKSTHSRHRNGSRSRNEPNAVRHRSVESSDGGRTRRRSRDDARRGSRETSTGERSQRRSRERSAGRSRDSTDHKRHSNHGVVHSRDYDVTRSMNDDATSRVSDDVTDPSSRRKTEQQKNVRRKPKRNSDDHVTENGGNPRRRKSVRDLASAFENQDLNVLPDSDEDDEVVQTKVNGSPARRDDYQAGQKNKNEFGR